MSILDPNPKLHYAKGDIYDFEPDVYDPTIIIALLLTIEQSCPGVLASVLRYLSHLTDPECEYYFSCPDDAVKWSLEHQKSVHTWLRAETFKLRQNLQQEMEDKNVQHA